MEEKRETKQTKSKLQANEKEKLRIQEKLS